MTDEQIFAVLSKDWPDKKVANIKAWIRQEHRDLVVEARRLIIEDVERASRLHRLQEGDVKWRELPEAEWEKIKHGESPLPYREVNS
jgi:hypothetical protein